VSRKRQKWEARYRAGDPSAFHWFSSDVPPQLAELLEDGKLPEGGALDVGCGPGTITMEMAARFDLVVGLDIAEGAVLRARTQPIPADRRHPVFLVAAAPDLPLRDGVFALVFDRGCLQILPERDWPAYFERVGEMLKPGGMFQLYASRPRPPLHTPRGLAWLARRLLRGGHRLSLPERIGRVAPPWLEPIEVRELDWDQRIRRRQQTYALFRKRG
jgi:SAM-dependent methyltransferase